MRTPDTGIQKHAVALHYDQVSAPRVTAKGQGDLAEQIIALAQEHGVPIRAEPELAQVLARIKLGDEIPEALYIAVAEIIAFIYILKGKLPDRYKDSLPRKGASD